jgi:hypothetical protein
MLTKFESYETEELLKKLRHRNIELGCVDTLGVEIEKRLEDLLGEHDELMRLIDRETELTDRIEELEGYIDECKRVILNNNLEVPEQ